MANTVYDNFVLESKLKDLLTTKLDTKTLMTIDNSLTESAGMIKNIKDGYPEWKGFCPCVVRVHQILF